MKDKAEIETRRRRGGMIGVAQDGVPALTPFVIVFFFLLLLSPYILLLPDNPAPLPCPPRALPTA
jgi:hypothetical protein